VEKDVLTTKWIIFDFRLLYQAKKARGKVIILTAGTYGGT